MKFLTPDGNQHDFTPTPGDRMLPNTVLVIYDKPWEHVSHILHICDKDCEANENQYIIVFNVQAVAWLMEMGYWQCLVEKQPPSEYAFGAWETLKQQKEYQDPLAIYELEFDADEVSNADDDDLWGELEGWAGA